MAKRFSLMDLIGAVLGTFLVTMLMFIIAYRTSKLYVYRRAKLRSQSDPMLRHRDHNKHNPDGTSSSAASSSLLKFSQLPVAPRYPPDYAQTGYQNPPLSGGLLVASKQRDSGTFTSQSTTSSQNANGQGGAYETVYNETSTNQLMYETPSDNLANAVAAACHQNQQSFIFPFAQAGYPIMFGSTLPSQQSTATAYALGVTSPSGPTYIPPPPNVQQPSLPRSIQSQSGPLQHVYSSTMHMGEHYHTPSVSMAVHTSVPSNPTPQLNHVT
ncbi:unnamed protein product [Rodentolepis nana]|uniref:Uncharacterized protein n=1 Tax=Rodentolepis nana TaxID=102285 RepID=A0A3P7S4D5_RODNA|nr:unnamed protein product [Rodentolepis nana]